jgi:hypothetical protein
LERIVRKIVLGTFLATGIAALAGSMNCYGAIFNGMLMSDTGLIQIEIPIRNAHCPRIPDRCRIEIPLPNPDPKMPD